MENKETCLDCMIKAYQLVIESLKQIPEKWYFYIILITMLFIVDFFYRKQLKIKKLNYDYLINLVLVYSAILFVLFLLPLSVFDTPKNDFIKILSSFGPWITAIAVIKFSFLQYKISQEQRNIAKYQGFVQRTSFLYNEFIQEKQNKIIELRKKYMSFQDACMYFVSMIFPVGVGEKDMQTCVVPNISMENSRNIIGAYHYNRIIQDETNFIIEFHNKCSELQNYLRSNEVFLSDNQVLYEDLLMISKAFRDLFESILSNEKLLEDILFLRKTFDKLCKTIDFRYALLPEVFVRVVAKRIYFYSFMQYRLIVERNNNREGLLSAVPNSIFRGDGFTYTAENINIWSNNDLIAFHTHAILNTWFETWKDAIDRCFKESFEDVKEILDNDVYLFPKGDYQINSDNSHLEKKSLK